MSSEPFVSIGDTPAFPVTRPDGTVEPGMTYRHWLIGMALSSGKSGPDSVYLSDFIIKSLNEARKRK